MPELSPAKLQQRKMWSLGDYPTFAEGLQPAADVLVERIGLTAGQDVLDVATGSGNAAIAAAVAGGRVTGLDLTPELFEVGRRRAAAGQWQIDWVEGDAEELPFADESFDAVLSVFGAMFAPDHRRTAAELVRVCRPGGTVGVCAWTPDGAFGRMIRQLMSRMPPPPPGFVPPALWGNQEYAAGLFGELGVRLGFERHHLLVEHESADAYVTFAEGVFGPFILAKAALAPTGEWDGLRAELVELYQSLNEAAEGGGLRVRLEYLLTIAGKAAPVRR